MENRDMLMESNNKYTLLITGSIKFKGRRLYRIQALTDFSDVKKGDIGGYVEGEHNLEPYGDCWIYDNGKAIHNAVVLDDARVTDYAVVQDQAVIRDNAIVENYSVIADDSVVCDNAIVRDDVIVQGDYVAGACEVLEGDGIYGDEEDREVDSAKYSLTYETIEFNGRTLCRIQALKDFGDVKKGDLGGYIEGEFNLSHKGGCWVSDDSKVMDSAMVCHNARVTDYAVVMDNALVNDNALIKDGATVSDRGWVSENVTVQGDYVVGACEVLEGNGTYGIKDNVTDSLNKYGEVSELDTYKNLFKVGKISLDELAVKCYGVGKDRDNDLTVYKYSDNK